ncbi:MAG: trehalose-6-phosphate synthase, partial [Cyanobacteria bacterium]|nr:trehalose-6-phosphate synthase [Cyanobacteriota bacterium]
MSTTVHPIPLLAPVSPEELVEADFHLPTVKVISYAGPGKTGGVSTSLEPIVKRLGTKVHWFSVEEEPESERNQDGTVTGVKSIGSRDGASMYSISRESESSFKFYNPELPKHIIDGHRRFAALHLWPLLHSQPEVAEFNLQDWRAYQQLCASLASRCQSVQQESFPTLFWIHDYQFAMTAPLVAAERGALVCQFWHVPWPVASKFVQSPVAKELVDAMLSNSVLGFHTAEYAHNFMETVEALFPSVSVDYMNMVISSTRRKTRITVMPLGLDIARW